MKRQAWISDTSNKKVKQIRESFQANLSQQAKDSRINYYDFLLVAKKLSFRFQESSHLMALKNFFSKNKNSILIKKLVDALAVNQQSLNTKDDKIIVKFNVPDNDFAPIKQATNQDEEQYYQDEQGSQFGQGNKNRIGQPLDDEHNDQINEKLTIILSIKLEQMHKKIKSLTNPFHFPNIFTVFDDYPNEQIQYEKFKAGILDVIVVIKQKIKVSQDDIKTLFHILSQDKGFVTLQDIQKLKDPDSINQPMKQFYYSRINRNMVKNTLFKLGKVKNSSIQIYQLKNASVLEFQQIQQSIVNQPTNKTIVAKKRIPHFGPLKNANKFRRNDKHYNSTDIKYAQTHHASHPKNGTQLDKQRQKIQRILRSSKESKKKDKSGDTVASKLRSLFIHKVILPRQKMLEQQKQKYSRAKIGDQNLAIRPLKDAH